MIQADFKECIGDDGMSLVLEVEGHANFDEHGRDIVCAGVSAITQALAGFVENTECECEYTENNCGGHINISVFEPTPAVGAAYEMAFIGLLQIEMSHPNYVTVTKSRCRV